MSDAERYEYAAREYLYALPNGAPWFRVEDYGGSPWWVFVVIGVVIGVTLTAGATYYLKRQRP